MNFIRHQQYLPKISKTSLELYGWQFDKEEIWCILVMFASGLLTSRKKCL